MGVGYSPDSPRISARLPPEGLGTLHVTSRLLARLQSEQMVLPANPIIVITGGSSGVGRNTAQAFAEKGARIVLAARNPDALEKTAEECRRRGAACVTYSLDVGDPATVDALARRAVEEFGGIDVWVNCAAVLAFGPFEAMPIEEFRRVVTTNLFGYVHGAHAALRQFRAQNNRGVLINVSSMLGAVGEPYVSSYVATKFAIRGWSACLRQEMRDTPGIQVCTLLPAALDTPIYQRAANNMGKVVRAVFPAYDPQRVAAAIVRFAERPRGEVVVSGFGHLVSLGSRLAPRLLEWMVARAGPRLQFEETPQAKTTGALFSAEDQPHAAEGGWRGYWRNKLSGGAAHRQGEPARKPTVTP
jgi:NAD(P)-dependent dehydrogenase (short-subunit alcohol dehydrogenase family)